MRFLRTLWEVACILGLAILGVALLPFAVVYYRRLFRANDGVRRGGHWDHP